jgi:hypothetical protein
MDDSRLCKQVYKESKQLHLRKKRGNWASTIKKILKKYNLLELWRDENKLLNLDGKGNREAKTVLDHRRFWRGFIHKKIGEYEEHRWKIKMEKKPKLRTYRTFKSKLILENYLNVNNVKGKKLMASLRSGTNTLEIEKGRWKGVDKEQRFCLKCDKKLVEDEKHFVTHCERYQHERGKLFEQISTLSNGKWNLSQMIADNQFSLLMAGTGDQYERKILSTFQCFIVKCFGLRKD